MSKRFTAAFQDELRNRIYPGQMTIEEELAQNSDLGDPPPRGVLVSDRTLLDQVRETHAAALNARKAYELAVWRAHEAGINNIRIARQVGMTEGAVRMLLARTRRPRELDRT